MPGEVLGELVPALKRLTAGLSDGFLRVPERRGKWSIIEVIQHLADVEIVYGVRVRQMLAEKQPTMLTFDQDAWARELKYNERKLEAAMAQLHALRTVNLALFRSLTHEQWNRLGVHSERGVESVYVTALSLAVHDDIHLRQVRRIVDILK